MSRWETEVEIGLSLHVSLSNTALYNFIQRISYTYIEHERAVPGSLRLDVSHYFVGVHRRERPSQDGKNSKGIKKFRGTDLVFRG